MAHPPDYTPIKIELLGQLSLSVGGASISGLTSERLQALLAYLLLHRHAPQPRQQVAVQLWPEATDADAKANLRRRLHELKQRLPEGDRWLHVKPKTVQWVVGAQDWFDVAEFEAGISADAPTVEQLAQAVNLYRGALLPSCYDDWMVPFRERLQQQAMTALETLITQLAEQQQIRAALGHAQQLLRIDPLYEPGYGHLMRLHAQAGDRASALRVYHQCMTLLQEELGVPPSPATYQLYETLLTLDDFPNPQKGSAATSPGLPQANSPSTDPIALDGEAQTIAPDFPLIGRQSEWSLVQQWYQDSLNQKQPNFLCLMGEPGIGKTRLLQELARDLQTTGGYIIWGKGYEAEMLRPFGFWLDAFETIGADALLADLKPIVLDVGTTATLNRERLFDTAVQFLEQLAQTANVLVVLDDLQWLDETSIAFCHYSARVLRQRVPVLFASTARPRELDANEPATKLIQNLHREQRIQAIALDALDCRATVDLAHCMGCTAADDQIFTQSGGNPLFVLEIARAQDQQPDQAISSLEALIQGRLQQVSEAAQELIPWAAALGHSFNPTTLAKVADCSLPRLLNAIDQLERHGIIRPGSTTQGEVSYIFTHDIVRQVAYEQFSAPRRQLIHTHIAQALHAIADASSPLIDAVAHHADLGSDHALAVTACLAASRRCLRVFAYGDAAELTQRGIQHCQYLLTQERIHHHIQLLHAYVHTVVPKQQVFTLQQQLQELIQAAADHGLKDDEATGLQALIVLNYDHGNLSAVQQQSLYAAEQSRPTSPTKTMDLLAKMAACLGGIEQEIPKAEALIAEAQAIGDRLGRQSIDVPYTWGCVRRFYGQLDEARSHFHIGWQLAQQAQDHWRECTCLTRLIMVEMEAHQPQAALTYCAEFTAVATQMGEGSETLHAAALEAIARYLLQKPEADRHLAQACAALEAIDSPSILAYVQTLAAEWEYDRGETQTVIQRAGVALEAAQRVDNPSEIALAETLLIQAYRRNGDTTQANRHQQELTQRCQTAAARLQTLSFRAQQRLTQLEQLEQNLSPSPSRPDAAQVSSS